MYIAFYLMNSKGFAVLRSFIDNYGSSSIYYVVAAKDKNLQKDHFEEIKNLALTSNIKFFERESFPEELERKFQGYKFSIGWRWLINNEYNLIVFHDSLLPKYRGFAPLVNSLINKERQLGVTALFADSQYDCGDIISQRSIRIDYPIRIQTAIELVEPLYYELVSETYQNLLHTGNLKAIRQDDTKATYSPWLDDEDYYIDWRWPAAKIERFVNAVGYPYKGAKTRLDDKTVIFQQVKAIDDCFVEHRERHIGKVLFMRKKCPVVICAKGLLKLIDIRCSDSNKLNIRFRSRFKSP